MILGLPWSKKSVPKKSQNPQLSLQGSSSPSPRLRVHPWAGLMPFVSLKVAALGWSWSRDKAFQRAKIRFDIVWYSILGYSWHIPTSQPWQLTWHTTCELKRKHTITYYTIYIYIHYTYLYSILTCFLYKKDVKLEKNKGKNKHPRIWQINPAFRSRLCGSAPGMSKLTQSTSEGTAPMANSPAPW